MKKDNNKKDDVMEAVQEVEKKSSDRLTGPILDGADIYLTRQDMLTLELAQALFVNATQAVKLTEWQIKDRIQQYEKEIALLNSSKNSFLRDAQEKQKALQQLQAEIEERYHLSLKEITYESVTGKINIVRKDSVGVAAS